MSRIDYVGLTADAYGVLRVVETLPFPPADRTRDLRRLASELQGASSANAKPADVQWAGVILDRAQKALRRLEDTSDAA